MRVIVVEYEASDPWRPNSPEPSVITIPEYWPHAAVERLMESIERRNEGDAYVRVTLQEARDPGQYACTWQLEVGETQAALTDGS
jgi:hypothetical protein